MTERFFTYFKIQDEMERTESPCVRCKEVFLLLIPAFPHGYLQRFLLGLCQTQPRVQKRMFLPAVIRQLTTVAIIKTRIRPTLFRLFNCCSDRNLQTNHFYSFRIQWRVPTSSKQDSAHLFMIGCGQICMLHY